MANVFIVIDTETTGLFEPELVEFGFSVFRKERKDFSLVYKYSELFKPSKPIEYSAMGVHHITNDDVKFQGSFPHKTLNLKNIIDGQILVKNIREDDVVFLVGHNVEFDLKVLPEFLDSVNLIKEPSDSELEFLEPDQFYHTSKVVYLLDTLKAARNVVDKKECGDHKNITLFYYFELNKILTIKDLHSVETDTLITGWLVNVMANKYGLARMFKGKEKEDYTVCMFPKYKNIKWDDVCRKDIDYVKFLKDKGKLNTEQISLIKSLGFKL